MSDYSLCLLNLRKASHAHCQVLVQLEGKVKVRLSFEEVLRWEGAFASTAGNVSAVELQQEKMVLAPTWDPEMKLKEKIGGRQKAWNAVLLEE